MVGKTVTRAQLAEAVYQEVGLSRSESAALVDEILSQVAESLMREGAVKISSFGTFSVRQKGHRVGRNPKTGDEVPILPRRVLVFRASQVLKDRINRIQATACWPPAAPPRWFSPLRSPQPSRRGRSSRRRRSAPSARWRTTCTSRSQGEDPAEAAPRQVAPEPAPAPARLTTTALRRRVRPLLVELVELRDRLRRAMG